MIIHLCVSEAFDIRFKGDTRIAGENTEIEVMSPYETITISYDIIIDAGEHMEWVLSSDTGEEVVLEGTGEFTVPSAERFILNRKPVIPISFFLYQNFPNPFNPITSITFEIPVGSDVQLSIYNLAGRKVRTLIHEIKDAGKHTIQLNGNNLPSGIYFYALDTPSNKLVKKLVLIKI